MCELLAMSANVPTDICFSFSGLSQRGGETGPHRDGFGVCFYEQGGLREFKDHLPSADSKIAKFLLTNPIHATTVLAHIRQANVGDVNLLNTHPFHRELWGRHWTFAHNGQMPISDVPEATFYQPVGTTDSEKIFCWLLSQLRHKYSMETDFLTLAEHLLVMCNQLNQMGVTNLLLTDGEYLFVFCSTKLTWITRKAPFGEASLSDVELSVDFSTVTNHTDIVSVIATAPLTENEKWHSMLSGEAVVFRNGKTVWHGFGPKVAHKPSTETSL